VTTDDPDIAARVRLMRDHGRETKYRHIAIGHGERLDALQAAVLRAKLPHLEEWTEARIERAARYAALLGRVGLAPPMVAPGNRHVYHQFVVRVPWRDEVDRAMKAAGIETGVHYPIPLHLQPAFAGAGPGEGAFPAAEAAAREVLSLPMYAELAEEQQTEVVETLASSLRGLKAGRAP
jgi:dTDP-4-amino-4,6-dideoxygalactose transaminase